MSNESDHREVPSSDDVLISTDFVEHYLRNDFWREVTRPFYDTTSIIGDESPPLEGTMRLQQVGRLQFASVTFNPQRYNRDRRIIAWSGLDHYLVAIVGADMFGDFAGTSVTARPGDICILDLTQVLLGQVAAGGMFSTLIPRRALAKACGHANLHGLTLKAHLPMTKLLATYLGGLSDISDQLADDEAAAVEDALVTILAAAVRGEQPNTVRDLPPLSVALHQRVLDFIDSNINNPDLSPDFILRHFNVSRAHLYRAFAGDGGISSVIRDRRLDAAFLELTQTDVIDRSISEIAFTLGFTNATHFLRCFRTRFGLTPSEARHARPSRSPTSELRAHFLDIRRRVLNPTN
ncbi:helix-turn-helix domain-containing protein [Caenibius sp. WL]|uniref:helix-turn-helix domain-containing protein n=1 Tax=Caenibius sp. WL TaxID=2872646 RepID=UPI001C98E6BA|nr:helix-turn-helix domain-containing protein [Caenibius sp. WL]QZP07027.1 helix-turn-helix domain-containing protein [Caenibius sp. WL]